MFPLLQPGLISYEHPQPEHTGSTLQAGNCCNPKFTTITPPLDSNLKRFLSNHVNFHQISPFFFQQIDHGFWDKHFNHLKHLVLLIPTCKVAPDFHQGMCYDLSTDATLAALRSFFERRGSLLEIRSYNATNFTAAVKIDDHPRQLLDEAIIQIAWDIVGTTPRPCTSGGVLERLNRSDINYLYTIIRPSRMISNPCKKIELLMNVRPTKTVLPSPFDIEALTSNLFLLGNIFVQHSSKKKTRNHQD